MKDTATSADILNDIWQFFSSVKLTVIVLIALALSSIIGTLIPQNQDPVAYVRAFGEFLYRIFHILDIFDMYHAWWFQFLLLLLTINIVVCSVDRLSATWKIVFVKNPSFKASRFKRLSQKEEFTSGQAVQTLQETFRPVMAKAFSYSTTEQISDGYHIFAEKGRWTRLGVYGVHLSVVLLLLGGLIGSIFGFDGFVNIPEGESVRSIRISNSNALLPLGFEVRCEDFDVSFYDTGMPKEYRSSLTILENGRPVVQKDIIVNDPLRYRGVNFFQSSYGNMPPKEAVVRFQVAKSGRSYEKTVNIGQQINLPENLGKFVIRDYTRDFNFRGRSIGEAFFAVLVKPEQAPLDIVLPVRFPEFDKMRSGELLISISQYTPRYFTGLQVTKDPGVWVVYSGFIILIVGCFISFFMSHQRVCVELTQRENKSRVTVSGFANRNKLGMQQKIFKISNKLKTLVEDVS